MFTGPVEVDETVIVSDRRNMKKHKRRKYAGRDLPKTIIVGAVDRASRLTVARIVPRSDRETLQDFVKQVAWPDAEIYTDENSCCRGMPFRHSTVNHRADQFAYGKVNTNSVESLWNLLKRSYAADYIWWSPKHADLYLAEMLRRYNVRTSPDPMAALLLAMEGIELPLRMLEAAREQSDQHAPPS